MTSMINVRLKQDAFIDGSSCRSGEALRIKAETFCSDYMIQIDDRGNPVGHNPPDPEPVVAAVHDDIRKNGQSKADELLGQSNVQIIKRRTEDIKEKVERELRAANAKVKVEDEPEPLTSNEERIAKVLEAVGRMDHNIDTQWTASGLPRIKFLEAVLGFDITREELDEITGGNVVRRTN